MKNFFRRAGSGIANFFRKIGRGISGFFKGINADKLAVLVKMQLKEKWNLTVLKNKKKLFIKTLLLITEIVAVAGVAYAMFYFCKLINLFSALNHVPLGVMALIFAVMTLFNLVSSLVDLTKSLYFSRDNLVLVTNPVNADMLFLSKLLVYYFDSVQKNFTFTVPVFLAYGMSSGLNPVFYLWLPVMMLFYSAVLVLLCGILSIPCSYVIAFLNRYKLVKTILYLALIGVVAYLAILVIGLIPSDINLIKSWVKVSKVLRGVIDNFTKHFGLFYIFTVFLCGKNDGIFKQFFTTYSWAVFLIMLGVIIVFFIVNMLVSRPVYLKMIAKGFEFSAGNGKKGKNKEASQNLSSMKYETKKLLRIPEVVSSSVLSLVVAPITIFALNTIYAAIKTRELGDIMIVGFNLLIICLFVLSNNINVGSIYSRDGEAWYIGRIIPIRPFGVMLSRLVYNAAVTFVLTAVTVGIYAWCAKITVMNAVLTGLAIYLLALAHMVWSAQVDFAFPQNDAFRREGSSVKNKNETTSMMYSFILSVAFAFFAFLLFLKSSGYIYLKLVILAAGIFVWRLLTFRSVVNALYREVRS